MNKSSYKSFLQKLKNITKFTKKNKKLIILAAISAGQDSICLINILENFKSNTNNLIKLEYIYIDHQWKNSSKTQVKHIINYLQYYQSKIYIYQIKKYCYSETQARLMRYQIIFSHASKYNNDIIITGHNLTDKIETFLQNLFKGTSIDGATSLSEYRTNINDFTLYRPLLDVSRNEIQWICRHLYLPIWSDQTNYYYYINRNRIRHELLPYLKNYFSINIEKHLKSFLHISHIDNEYLKQNTIKIYLYIRHNNLLAINRHNLMKQHISIQKRILQLFSFHHFNEVFHKDLIEMLIINLIHANQYKCIKLKWNTNKTICIQKDWIYIH